MGAGEVVKNGGRVMKNVTGYDLVKLMAGSRGVLGVLTEVSFKVQAIPEAEATLGLEGLDDAAGLAVLRRALGSPFDVSGAARVAGRSLIRVEGMAGSVAYRVGRLRALAGGGCDGGRGGGKCRAVARCARCRRALPGGRAIWAAGAGADGGGGGGAALGGEAVFDWGGGLIWLCLPEGRDAAVRAAVAGQGVPREMAGAGAPPFAPEAPEVAALSAGLRAQFDPRGILNRGLI
jgi:glycolate oxidase FAD binding subunit